MNKTLIFSEENDFTVNRVIDWLSYYDHSYDKFVGKTDNSDYFKYNDKTFSFIFGGKGKLNSHSILENGRPVINSSTWFRRPYQRLDHFVRESYDYEGTYPKEKLDKTIYHRLRIFYDFLAHKLSERKHFGSFRVYELNKPVVLLKAQELGLIVPKTLITNSLVELKQFHKSCDEKIITKSLHEIMNDHELEMDNNGHLVFYQRTKLVNINKAPKTFAPSLFQEYIEKEYEIRSIYLNGQFYSAAIFSQLNEQTKVDMRNRDANSPARYVPYQLPEDVESKLDSLLKDSNLDFGAIDIIKSLDDQYYFLEINPVGQFGDVSIICNYYLEKKIAEYLIKDYML